jgi:RNA polymerase sigma factor (sigma-70 family)
VRYETLSDAELLRVAGDEPAAFSELYDRYEALIVSYFGRRTRDPELTADLTAEVFAAALGAAPRFRSDSGSAAPWLFTIAHHTLTRSVRRGKVEARARRRLGIRDSFELAAGQAERIEAVAGDAWVEELMRRLPEDQRDAVRARILEDQPYEEIAARLKSSELVIRKRVSRGLATLRRHVEDLR